MEKYDISTVPNESSFDENCEAIPNSQTDLVESRPKLLSLFTQKRATAKPKIVGSSATVAKTIAASGTKKSTKIVHHIAETASAIEGSSPDGNQTTTITNSCTFVKPQPVDNSKLVVPKADENEAFKIPATVAARSDSSEYKNSFVASPMKDITNMKRQSSISERDYRVKKPKLTQRESNVVPVVRSGSTLKAGSVYRGYVWNLSFTVSHLCIQTGITENKF